MKVGSHIGMPWLKLDLNRAEGGFKGEECEGGEAGCYPTTAHRATFAN